MPTRKEELRDLVAKLIPLGEDAHELKFWEEIFEDLSEEDQIKVLENLRTELKSLEGL